MAETKLEDMMFVRKATRFIVLYNRKPSSLLCTACYITMNDIA